MESSKKSFTQNYRSSSHRFEEAAVKVDDQGKRRRFRQRPVKKGSKPEPQNPNNNSSWF